MSIGTIDMIVNLSLGVFLLVLAVLVAIAIVGYVVKTDPDPRRLTIRAAVVLALLWDHATGPKRVTA